MSEEVHLTIRYSEVAEIPGAISEGTSREEARSNVLDALAVLLTPDEELNGSPATDDSESLTLTISS